MTARPQVLSTRPSTGVYYPRVDDTRTRKPATMDRLDQHPADSLSALLSGFKVHSTVFCVSDLGAPWGFHVDDSAVAKFHLALEGSCVLTLDTGGATEIGCGDLVLLIAGTGHRVQDRPGSRVRELDGILADHPVDAASRLEYG